MSSGKSGHFVGGAPAAAAPPALLKNLKNSESGVSTIAVLPSIAAAIWNIQIAFSGVSLLIVVGVALETMKQIESQLTMRNYEGILT